VLFLISTVFFCFYISHTRLQQTVELSICKTLLWIITFWKQLDGVEQRNKNICKVAFLICIIKHKLYLDWLLSCIAEKAMNVRILSTN